MFVQPQNRFLFLYPFRIANLCILTAAALHVLSCLQERRPLIRFGPATIMALLLLMSGLISLYVGTYQTSTAWNSYIDNLAKGVVALILVEAMATSVERVWAIQATMMISTLWWIKAGLRLSLGGATYAGDRVMGAAVSMVENPNGFAYMLCVFLPVYLFFYQQVPQKYIKAFFLAITLSAVYIVFETGSRTGLVSLILLGVFLIPKYGRHHIKTLALIGVAVFFLLSAVGELNIQRFRSIPDSIRSFLSGEIKESSQLSQDEESAQARRLKNRDTWALIKDHPLFGVGVSADESKYADRYPHAAGQVHNELLMAGRQMGIIGMGLYVAMLLIIFTRGRDVQRMSVEWWPALSDLGWTYKMQTLVFVVGGAFSPLPWIPPQMLIVGSVSALWLNARQFEDEMAKRIP